MPEGRLLRLVVVDRLAPRTKLSCNSPPPGRDQSLERGSTTDVTAAGALGAFQTRE